MRHLLHGVIAAAMGILLLCSSWALADGGFALAGEREAVEVRFASGGTELYTIADGVKFFSNDDYVLDKYPSELSNLTFTRRALSDAAEVTIDAPAGSTVYVAVGTGSGGRPSRAALDSGGWTRIGELYWKGQKNAAMGVYKHSFTESQRVTIPTRGGAMGVIVAARQLILSNPQPPSDEKPKAAETPQNNVPSNVSLQSTDPDAPARRISKLQASIKMLCVLEQANGDALGSATELILTVAPGSPRGDSIPVTFAIPVGKQMNLVLGDVARAIDAKYP
ncbi:MAG: hypothetical protein ABSH08_01950, partial [Tepidisphaeraceae bacterium]